MISQSSEWSYNRKGRWSKRIASQRKGQEQQRAVETDSVAAEIGQCCYNEHSAGSLTAVIRDSIIIESEGRAQRTAHSTRESDAAVIPAQPMWKLQQLLALSRLRLNRIEHRSGKSIAGGVGRRQRLGREHCSTIKHRSRETSQRESTSAEQR
jgi:hypothetical protein